MASHAPAGAWTPSSWRSCPIRQQPCYRDAHALRSAVESIRALPPLCPPAEIECLRRRLAEVAEGRRFLLQGGACAERFTDCHAPTIETNLRLLFRLASILSHGARVPAVVVGRMAGQYSKPRSRATEFIDGKHVPSYRGDNVNCCEPWAREPDPDRLLHGYFHSAATLNYVRALLASDPAGLQGAQTHHDNSTAGSPAKVASEALHTRSQSPPSTPAAASDAFFVSHEGLHLEYEEAMTEARPAPAGAGAHPPCYYDTSAHFLWIGDRTRHLDHAHVEFFRGVRNPIGIKLGPSTAPAEVVALVRTLWPSPCREPGRITLITRLGADSVESVLPPLVEAVRDAELPVVWCCDPMHGNTRVSEQGLKTRSVSAILRELRSTFDVHARLGTHLGGIHLEMTGDNVTECTGGLDGVTEADLPRRYTTSCDPRLNCKQAIEVAFAVAVHCSKAVDQSAEDEKEAPAM